MAGGALPGGREASRSAAGSRRQVSRPKEISLAENNLGRRAEDALFQGENQIVAEGMVSSGPLSESGQKEGTGRRDGTHADAGRELVQEQEAKGSRCCSEKQVCGNSVFFLIRLTHPRGITKEIYDRFNKFQYCILCYFHFFLLLYVYILRDTQ